MLPDLEDHDLRARYRELRRVESEGVPDFRTLFDRAREDASGPGLEAHSTARISKTMVRRLAWGGSVLAAAAAAALLLVPIPGTSDSEFVNVVQAFSADPAAGAWISPTDGLLELPGSEILSSVPTLGPDRWLTNPGFDPQRNEL